jgi:bacillithiol biosynthesis cysteine-adding enzyme BshC
MKLLEAELGTSKAAKDLIDLFKKAYVDHSTLSEATFYLANELFKEDGLVVLEPNKKELKELFIPQIKKDLFNQIGFKKVSEQIELLTKESYSIQVNPRELNFFYLKEGLRERIVEENTVYTVLNTDLKFTKEELELELEQHPERFSPNVITRPLYQEVILPNLAYIGGGGELAYWLELKSMFEAQEIPFPILMIRDSVLIISKKQSVKMDKLGLSNADLFLKRGDLINKHIRKISNIDIDLSPIKNQLNEHFEALYEIAKQTDASFLGAVKAQEKKQLKGVAKLEKRLLKAQKHKLSSEVVRLVDLQEELFPREGLQERNTNFSEFYLEYPHTFKEALLKNLNPLKKEFTILKL